MKNNDSKKKPCNECPFLRRDRPTPEDLGGAPVETYIGQALGPFWLPCHKDKNYQGKQSNPEEVIQCAGAAIFRANIKVADTLPDMLLKLPENPDLVYQDLFEFYWRGNGYHNRGYSNIVMELNDKYPHPTSPYLKMMEDEVKKLEVFQITKIKIIK